MDENSGEKEKMQQFLEGKGGTRTMPFIIVNESCEKVASFGLIANMILYLIMEYHMSNANGASILFFWSAVSSFTPIFGAFLADAYLGKFKVIVISSIASFLGIFFIWLTAVIPKTQPPPCNISLGPCKSPTPAQLSLLFAAFVLISIGSGGIRPCSISFGADQYDKDDNPKRKRVIQSFFNWYYASVGISVGLALTLIVYIQNEKGWAIGFAVPASLMLLATILIVVGSPLYVKIKPKKSLFTDLVRVLVVTFKRRNVHLPSNISDGSYYHLDSEITSPTNKLRFLNKACLIRNFEEVKPDGTASNPWSLCTIAQVEDMKALIRVLPICSTGIIISMAVNQASFPVLQAITMDRRLTTNFSIPPGSFGVFAVITMTIWACSYDRVIVPLIRKFTGRSRGLSIKLRLGLGLLVSCAATLAAAIVERQRRRMAIKLGLIDKPMVPVSMSAMWLILQFGLNGIAEGLNAIGQIEFYYSELPKGLSSIGVALFSVGSGIGNLLGSLVVKLIDVITEKGGNDSWVSTNLNRGHYDYYYWVITVLGFLNFLYFLLCSWCYGSCKFDEETKDHDQEGIENEGRDVRQYGESRVLF